MSLPNWIYEPSLSCLTSGSLVLSGEVTGGEQPSGFVVMGLHRDARVELFKDGS